MAAMARRGTTTTKTNMAASENGASARVVQYTKSLEHACIIVYKIALSAWQVVTGAATDPRFPLTALTFCLAVWAYQYTFESRAKRLLAFRPVRITGMLCILLYLMYFTTSGITPFIYFAF